MSTVGYFILCADSCIDLEVELEMPLMSGTMVRGTHSMYTFVCMHVHTHHAHVQTCKIKYSRMYCACVCTYMHNLTSYCLR